MGSWYTTCALTNLPIIDDEQVKVVVVRKNGKKQQRGGGFSNPDDSYKPITLPFNAVYDDCGRIKEIDALGVAELKRINPLEYEGDEFDIGGIIEHILRESYDDYGLYIVRRDIFDRMIKFYKCLDDYRDTLKEGRVWLHFEKLVSWGVIDTSIIHRTNLDEYKGKITEGMMDLILYNYVLEELRRSWNVPTGAGSQARSYDYHQELAEYILETIRKEDERLNEDF